ncbi:MAG: hypothetical protein CMQ21_05710 [Gammaproteobacteria bacterium]|nr:hypothetical protein [Gammaproteobacteria bacterium]
MTSIYQITDTHIILENDDLARNHFLILMEHFRKEPADILVISGDLPGIDGSLEIYQWMKKQIPSAQETYVIPGNHDDADNLYTAFGDDMCVNSDFLFTIPLSEIDIVFSNTGSNRFPEDQLAYLQDASIRENSILFTHYPTTRLTKGFMDTNYPLANASEADKVISGSNISHVFCGHYHTEHSINNDYQLNVTPSPAFEIDLYSTEFKLHKTRIPFRHIEVDGTNTQSSVIYLDS